MERVVRGQRGVLTIRGIQRGSVITSENGVEYKLCNMSLTKVTELDLYAQLIEMPNGTYKLVRQIVIGYRNLV